MIRFVSAIFLYFSLSSAMGIGGGLTILLDRSNPYREDSINSVNCLLAETERIDPTTPVSLYICHDKVDQQINKQLVSEIVPYTDEIYPKINKGTKFLVALKKVIDNILKDKTNVPHKIYVFTGGDDEDIREKKIHKDFLQESMQKAEEQNIDLQIVLYFADQANATNIVKQLKEHHIPIEKIKLRHKDPSLRTTELVEKMIIHEIIRDSLDLWFYSDLTE